MVNKVLVVIVVVLLAIVALVVAVLLATGAVRFGGNQVEEVFCTAPDGELVMCEDLP